MPTGTSTAPGSAAATTSSHPAREPLTSKSTSASRPDAASSAATDCSPREERPLGTEIAREREPRLRSVDGEHARTDGRGGVREEGADPADAQHDGILARRQTAPRDSVHRDGHGLREGEGVGTQAPRRDVEQGRGGHAGELREPSVDLQPRRPVAPAQVGAAGPARLARAARDPRAAHDLGTEGQIDAVAHRLDRAGELVAEHDRQVREDRAAGVFRGIRSAHSASAHTNERLTGPGGRHGPALDAQVARAVQHRRAHARHSETPSGTASWTAWRDSIMRERCASYTAACAGESRYAASASSSATSATTA